MPCSASLDCSSRALVVVPVGLGYVTTHTARAVVPPNHLGVANENVKFKTSDGLELEGWYVPSRNGAAVIAFPGRNGPQQQTRMLARHGYGVLLFDRRGEGDSDGEPNSWGWGGEADIKAAIAYLQHRPDVEPDRIGGIGLSVGGEMMIEAAAETDELAAVVSEGAGARSIDRGHGPGQPGAREVDAGSRHVRGQDRGGRGVLQPVAAGEPEGPRREDQAAPAADRGPEQARTASSSTAATARAAGESETLWEIPESTHVGGIRARPASTSGASSGSSTRRCGHEPPALCRDARLPWRRQHPAGPRARRRGAASLGRHAELAVRAAAAATAGVGSTGLPWVGERHASTAVRLRIAMKSWPPALPAS